MFWSSYAMAYHTRPRYTEDIDLLVRPSQENAARVEAVLKDFGFAVVQLGHPPNRIDLMTSISGVSFDEARQGRQFGELDGVRVAFLDKGCLVRNKRASGQEKDLEDLKRLS
jgi:hypothetical protein